MPVTCAQTAEILARLLLEDLYLAAVAGCHEEMLALGIYITCQCAVGIADAALQLQCFSIENIDAFAGKVGNIQVFAIVIEVYGIQLSASDILGCAREVAI